MRDFALAWRRDIISIIGPLRIEVHSLASLSILYNRAGADEN